MRKFSKVFAMLLTLCLIFGMLYTAAFAEEFSASKDLIPSDNVENVARIDFESNPTGDTAYATTKTSGLPDYSKYGWLSKNGNTIHDVVVATQTGLDGVTTNNYLRFSRFLEGSSTEGSSYWDCRMGIYENLTHQSEDYSYAVADFDFGCDEYEYVLNGEVCYGSTVPEGATDVSLNYPSGIQLFMSVRPGDDAKPAYNGAYQQAFYLYILKNGNDHYLSGDEFYQPENDILISNTAGVWNHITMVFETDRENIANAMLRYYYNGQLVVERLANTKGPKYLNFESIRFQFGSAVVASGEHYTFCVDNLAVNYYGLDYNSGPDVYGIDDYYIDPDHKSKNISDCADIVYNDSYTYYGTMTPYVAVVQHDDDTANYFYNTKKALAFIRDGDFVTLKRDLLDFMPNEGVKEITFITEDDAEFTIAGDALDYYKLQHTGNRYTLNLIEDTAIDLTWYDSQGENRQPVKVQKVVPLFAPNAASYKLNIHGIIDKSDPSNPKIEIVDKWEWDMNNDGISDGKDLCSFTVAEINELREKGFNKLSIVPVFKEMELKYEVYVPNAEGELEYFVPNNDYSLFTDGSKIYEVIAGLPEGCVANVVLYDEAALSSSIEIPEGVTVNFDLNGKKLSSDVNLFVANDGSTLNLYSAVAGAEVESAAEVFKPSAYADICTINVGEFKKDTFETFSGDNVKVIGSSIVSPIQNSKIQCNALKICLNVNGGEYVSTGTAFIATTGAAYYINGATVISDTNAINALKDATDVNITINNSLVHASKFISDWNNKGCIVSVEKSIITGFAHEANVSLGVYNKVVYNDVGTIKVDGSNIPVASDVLFAMASNNAKTDTVDIKGEDVRLSYNVLTYPAVIADEYLADFAGAVEVKWLDPDQNVYMTSVWYADSTVTKPEISFGIKKLDNGWYNRKYSDWINVTEGADKDSYIVTEAVENKFAPEANIFLEDLDVKISLQISDTFGYNVYLPAIPDENVQFVGFYVGGEKVENGVFENVTVDGEEGCIRFAGSIALDKLVSDSITIKYIAGDTELCKENVVIDVIDYVKNVADAYECGSAECKVVFAMMNYKLETYKKAYNVENDDFTITIGDFFKYHEGECTCLDVDAEEVESATDYEAIAEQLVGFDYALEVNSDKNSTAKYTFAVQLKKDAGVTAINGKIADETFGDADLVFVKSEYAEYIEYRAELDLAYANKLISLTVSYGEEARVDVSFDLAGKIADSKDPISVALYVLSGAAYAEKQ